MRPHAVLLPLLVLFVRMLKHSSQIWAFLQAVMTEQTSLWQLMRMWFIRHARTEDLLASSGWKRRITLPFATILSTIMLPIGLAETGWAEPLTPSMTPGLPAGPGSAQDQFQRFRQHQQQLDSLPPPTADVQIAPQPTPQDNTPTCMPIHKVSINGARHLPAGELAHIAAAYEGRCLGVKDLNALVNQLNEAYVKHGYITSRAYLPEQKLSSGITAEIQHTPMGHLRTSLMPRNFKTNYKRASLGHSLSGRS